MYKISPINSKEIARIVKGVHYGEASDIEYISIDTREKFNINTVYIAIKGKLYDGNDFINEAISKGCSLIISSVDIKSKIPYIKVENTIHALGSLSKYLSKNIRKIGITGSVGKTTVKEMIYLVLKEKYNASKTEKNENNEIGVPLTLLNSINNDICIVEMGMRGLNEIDYLSFLCEPEISVITNIGTAHLEKLKTIENIFKAKTEIIPNTKSIAIVPYDKRFLSYNYGEIKPIFIGKDVASKNIRYGNFGIEFDADCFGEIIKGFKLNTFNESYINNALIAICVGKIYLIPNYSILKAINSYACENMHGEIIKINGISVILDCYNASYESTKEALFSLKRYAEQNNKSPYLLIGDMLEIGEKTNEFHYRIGELAKDLCIKNIYATGNMTENTLDGFLGGTFFSDKREIAKEIIKDLNENDVILVKGSRKMKLEQIVEYMKEMQNV